MTTITFDSWASYLAQQTLTFDTVEPSTVGAAPYLDSDDGDASYISMTPQAFNKLVKVAVVTFPDNYTFCGATTVSISAKVRFAGVLEAATVYPAFGLSVPDPTNDDKYVYDLRWPFVMTAYTRSATWQTVTGSVSVSEGDASLLNDYMALGTAGVYVQWGTAIAGWTVEVGYISVTADLCTTPTGDLVAPLRQNQRDDLRQNQRTSRQLTVRQRGYL